jgi:tetratricopeptide (TPR) repeat protein
MTTTKELKNDYEAALRRMFGALQKDDRYKEETEACETSRKRYENQDTRDRVLGALEAAQEEAENLWDGCNHMIDEAVEAYDAAMKAYKEAVDQYGDNNDPALWGTLWETKGSVERAEEDAEAWYKVYRKAEDTYLEAKSLLNGASQEAHGQAA